MARRRQTWKPGSQFLRRQFSKSIADTVSLTAIMASQNTKDFVKLRHKTRVFNSSNIAALRSALDLSDLVSLVFFMCGNDQIKEMHAFLSSTNCTSVASLDLFKMFQTFPRWERTLPEALGAIKNGLALMKLDISPTDVMYNRRMKDSESVLCPTRVALYRIIDDLRVQGGKNLISKMKEFGAPPPPRYTHLENITHLELLCFMFWHSQGFLNIERRANFELIAESLISINRSDLVDSLDLASMSPQVLHDSYVFDDHPLGVYLIKSPDNPGLCVIINQVRYGGNKNRDSSEVNMNDLARLMYSLNFSVITIENLPEPGFCERIKTIVENDFSRDHSIFILVIMSHGGREGVICPPGESGIEEKGDNLDLKVVRIDDIQHSLFECKELETIPKVLVLNSCRGDFEFTARDYFQMAADAPDRREILSHVDIITCYSALPKYVSWRDRQKGSAFINVFCDILTKRPDIEICELFTLMNARLMRPTVDMSAAFGPNHKGYENKIAMPFDFTSSLRKKLYFKLPEMFKT